MLEEKEFTITKKWHQRWWGIIILITLVILFVFVAIFIYQLVITVEAQTQAQFQKYALSQKPVTTSIDQELGIRKELETKDDPSWGPDDAKIVIVEFSDFQCPFCKQAFPIIQKIKREYQDSVKIIYRDMPIVNIHPDALNAAMAAECADDQDKFWQYHDNIFINQDDLSVGNLKLIASQIGLDLNEFNECFTSEKYLSEVQNDLQDGLRFGVTGTPTFFINGIKIPGVIPYNTFKQIIDKLLKTSL